MVGWRVEGVGGWGDGHGGGDVGGKERRAGDGGYFGGGVGGEVEFVVDKGGMKVGVGGGGR